MLATGRLAWPALVADTAGVPAMVPAGTAANQPGRVVKREFKRPPAGESKPSPRHETAVITAEPTLEELKQQIATKLKGKVKTKEEMEDLLIPIIGVTVISTVEEAELVLEAIT